MALGKSSLSPGVQSREESVSGFSYPLSFGSEEEGLGKYTGETGRVSEAYQRKSPISVEWMHLWPLSSLEFIQNPLSALDSSSGTILSHAHSTDQKAGAQKREQR